MLKYVLLITLICLRSGANSVELPIIQGCAITLSTKIICDEQNNASSLPDIPAYTTSSLRLYVHNRKIPVIPENIYNGLSFTTLELSNNEIEVISNGALQAIQTDTLKYLYLSNNNIKSIDFIFRNNSFSKNCMVFSQLKKLRLNTNKISHIKTLECLTRLEELWLNNNEMASIDADAFHNLPRLSILLLTSNLLKNVFFLKNCHSPLYRLIISNNVINFKQNSNIFGNFRSLNTLEMSHNNLSSIDDETFKGLNSLTTLDITSNNIKFISNNSFSSSSRLRNLFLENNYFTEINPNLFKKNYFLSFLSLRNSSISLIRNGDFLYSSYLNVLILSFNSIEEIQDESFIMTPYITELDFTYNRLTNISERMFNGINQLRILYLGNNRITKIHQKSFENFLYLENLYLQNNLIESIDTRFPSSLRHLELQNNKIQYLKSQAFEQSSHLLYFDISNNRVKYIENNLFFYTSLKKVSINKNTISGIGSNVFRTDLIYESIDLQFNNLTKIPKSSFNNVSLFWLDLSHNNIIVIEKNNFDNIKFIENILCKNNRISSLEIGAFNGLPSKFEFFDLSSNQIIRIENLNQLDLIACEILSFENNQINFIGKNAFTRLDIKRLNLVGNPIKQINPQITDDLTRLSFVFFSSETLTNLDIKVFVDAFSPNKIIKQNIYKYYKAIFFRSKIDFYDNTFCSITIKLLRHNILLNLIDISEIETVLNKCPVVSEYSNKLVKTEF